MKLESNWLMSSHTVAQIQRFFGLELLEPTSSSDSTTIKTEQSQQNGTTTANGHDRNSNHYHNGAMQHRGHKQNGNVENTEPMKESVAEEPRYRVNNWFWYWVFAFGASLGDDIFYYTVYPFWFYNLSPWVIRRVMLMWGVVMYIGQSSKEILRWPRPSEPPVVRIERRYFLEYGMPSTHAMVGTLVPFTILASTWNHYEYSHTVGVILASSYTLLVCFSRLYRGMHYILDVVVGINITVVLLGIMLPFIDKMDYLLLTNPVALIIMFAVTLIALVYHPCEEQWNDLRADTTIIVAVVNGVFVACWILNQLGLVEDLVAPIPHEIIWPGFQTVFLMLLRSVVGCCIYGLMHEIARRLMLVILSLILGRKIDRKGPKEIIVEFPYKYITYFTVGASIFLPLPIFNLLGI